VSGDDLTPEKYDITSQAKVAFMASCTF
jgi:hypothetical protein